jgi:phage terminase large subunit-like protein
MIKIRQGMYSLNEPTKFVRKAILRNELKHPGNPVLDWNIRNAQVVSDHQKNEMLSKSHSAGKIDGLAALINGARLILDTEPPRQKSIYKTGGFRSI